MKYENAHQSDIIDQIAMKSLIKLVYWILNYIFLGIFSLFPAGNVLALHKPTVNELMD